MSNDQELLSAAMSISKPNIADDTISTILIGGAGAMVYIVLTMDKYTLIGCIRALVLGVFMSWMVWQGIGDSHDIAGVPLTIGSKNVIMSLCSVSADYIMVTFLRVSKAFFSDPRNVLKLLLGRWI